MAREIICKDRPLIMGVLNVTPDSFYDGGKFYAPEEAIKHALKMVEEGADIIDVGGESTRPFSERISPEEELKRAIPVIEGIRAKSNVVISIDTYKTKVAKEAVETGADMVNDISGLRFDKDMARVIGKLGVYVVVMHMKGTPKDMQEDPYYDDVITEIKNFFIERMAYAKRCGIKEDNIILDPGIGFGKRVEDNLKIIKMLQSFKDFGRPLLIGTSMKTFIGKVTDSPLEERTDGTLASIAISVWNGADIIRVHDAKKARRVVKLVDAIRKSC